MKHLKTIIAVVAMVLLFGANRASAQWTVIDPSNIAQSIVNNTKALVNALHDEASIKFYDCKFIFNSLDKSCRVIDLKSYSATFERCYFTQCGADAIYLGCSDPNRIEKSTYGTFTFKDNNINKCNKGLFIRADDLRSKPIIEGNTFEDITLINSYMISISHNQNEIIFTNNTFSHITTSGNENGDNGGVGISVFSSNSEYTIKYIKCNFTSITNNHEKVPDNHGGALQIGFTNNSNANIEIIECEFKNNIVKGGHGGGTCHVVNKARIPVLAVEPLHKCLGQLRILAVGSYAHKGISLYHNSKRLRLGVSYRQIETAQLGIIFGAVLNVL